MSKVTHTDQTPTLVPELITLAAKAWAADDPNVLFVRLSELQAQGWKFNELMALLVTALARCAGEAGAV